MIVRMWSESRSRRLDDLDDVSHRRVRTPPGPERNSTESDLVVFLESDTLESAVDSCLVRRPGGLARADHPSGPQLPGGTDSGRRDDDRLDRRRVTGVHLPDRPGAAVLAATFFHGSFNAVGSLSLVYLTGAGNLLTAAVGVAGIGAAVVAVATCVVHDRFFADERITTGEPLSPWA